MAGVRRVDVAGLKLDLAQQRLKKSLGELWGRVKRGKPRDEPLNALVAPDQ
jgi:hypothetical protein